MVQMAVKELCGLSEKRTDDLDADQLAAATKHIDALAHSSDDIRALLPHQARAPGGLQLKGVAASEQRQLAWRLPGDCNQRPIKERNEIRHGHPQLWRSVRPGSWTTRGLTFTFDARQKSDEIWDAVYHHGKREWPDSGILANSDPSPHTSH